MGRPDRKVFESMKPPLETDDDPTPELAHDAIPDASQEEPIATYRDWNPYETRVVVYAVGGSTYPGIKVGSRAQALAHCRATYGPVVGANYVHGRAFLRVRRK